jgi:sugar phosphate isomerase/epimerase
VPADLIAVRRLFDGLGLTAASRHVRMADVFSNWRRVLSDCQILGNRQLVCDEVPAAERATLDGYKKVADLLNAAGKITQWAGVQLVVRPHADDLRARAGVVPYDYLLSNTNPALVKFEPDLAVMATAKRDLIEDFARYRGRFVSLHLHETTPDPRVGRAADPAVDLAKILAAAQNAGVQHYFVSDDRPDPAWERAKAMFASLTRA